MCQSTVYLVFRNLEREKGGRDKKKQKEKERVCVLIPDDNEKDNKKRLYMIVSEIKRINNNKIDIINFYKNNKDRFEKNKQIVMEISEDKNDFNYYQNLIHKI